MVTCLSLRCGKPGTLAAEDPTQGVPPGDETAAPPSGDVADTTSAESTPFVGVDAKKRQRLEEVPEATAMSDDVEASQAVQVVRTTSCATGKIPLYLLSSLALCDQGIQVGLSSQGLSYLFPLSGAHLWLLGLFISSPSGP